MTTNCVQATRKVFEQQRTRLILQDLREALRMWLPQMTIPAYASVIEASAEATAAGN